MANEYTELIFSTGDYAAEVEGSFYVTGFTEVGHNSDTGVSSNSAFRFNTVDIPQGFTLNTAELLIRASSKVGSNTLRVICYGIDEDNTSNFGSDPFGRSRTSASNTHSSNIGSIGSYFSIGVTSMANEILGRGGWSANNSMGFLVFDDGSDTGCRILNGSGESYLMYRLAALPDFTPTPVTVAAPTIPGIPTTGDYIVAISRPGTDVIEEVIAGNEDNIWFSSWKQKYKVFTQDAFAATGGVTYAVAHGLGYRPMILVYARKNGYSFNLPRWFGGAVDPVGGGVQGFCYSTTTDLIVNVALDADIYYYIFYDEQAA